MYIYIEFIQINFFPIQISTNGYVSLGSRVDIIPSSPLRTGSGIIVPLGMDLDLTGSRGTVQSGVIYHHVYENFDIDSISSSSIKDLYNRVRREIVQAHGDTSFVPTVITTITWINCPQFPYDKDRVESEVNIESLKINLT